MAYINTQYQNTQVYNPYSLAFNSRDRSQASDAAGRATGSHDNVNISTEGKHRANFADNQEAALADGTKISVSRSYIHSENADRPLDESHVYSVTLTGKDGKSFTVDFMGDAQITRNSDGTYAFYFANSDTTRTYTGDGTYTETAGATADPNADTVYINTGENRTVTTGNGNNTVFVYGHMTTVNGGTGNDTVIVASGWSHTINTGDGDDTVRGDAIIDSAVNLGSGNNTIEGRYLSGGTVTGGDGNNSVNFLTMEGTRMTLGGGDNAIDITYLRDDATIVAGNGGNSFTAYSLGQNGSAPSSAHVSFGNGDNTVQVAEMLNGSTLDLGNGDNTLNVAVLKDDSSLTVGDGDNTIDIYETAGASSVSIGHGNNTITIYETEDSSTVFLGNGDNTVDIHTTRNDSSVSLGNGQNTLRILAMEDNSRLTAGDGHNALRIGTARDRAAVTLGGGDNMVAANLEGSASILFGNGNNLWTGNASENTSVEFGSGDNTVIPQESIEPEIIFGDGYNAVHAAVSGNEEDYLKMIMEWETARRERLGLDLPLPDALKTSSEEWGDDFFMQRERLVNGTTAAGAPAARPNDIRAARAMAAYGMRMWA